MNAEGYTPEEQMERLYWSVSEMMAQMWRLLEANPSQSEHFKQRMGWVQKESNWMMEQLSPQKKNDQP